MGALHIVHIRLEDGSPVGLQIQVNRWTEPYEGDYMNVKITMHGQKGQDGHCGNFNGDPQDDDRLQVRARVGKTGVDPRDSMYATKTPVMVAHRPNINDCPAQQLEDAKTLCKQKEKHQHNQTVLKKDKGQLACKQWQAALYSLVY